MDATELVCERDLLRKGMAKRETGFRQGSLAEGGKKTPKPGRTRREEKKSVLALSSTVE